MMLQVSMALLPSGERVPLRAAVNPRGGVRTRRISRSRLAGEPADILITTPESLYLLLTSNAREALRSIDTVIIVLTAGFALMTFDAVRHAHQALAVGVESLIDHHGPDDAGRAVGDRRP